MSTAGKIEIGRGGEKTVRGEAGMRKMTTRRPRRRRRGGGGGVEDPAVALREAVELMRLRRKAESCVALWCELG